MQISLQQHGLKDWSVQLLSIVTTVPSSGTPAALPCQSAFGKWCLDGTFWSPAAIVTLIAFGAAIVVLLAIALIVYREVRRRSGLVRFPFTFLLSCMQTCIHAGIH